MLAVTLKASGGGNVVVQALRVVLADGILSKVVRVYQKLLENLSVFCKISFISMYHTVSRLITCFILYLGFSLFCI